MHTVVMPKMGDTMEEGKILNWLKHEGDTVNKGDALAEIETEKVNIEVEAFAGGVLRKIIVPAGQTVPVGAPIALTGSADEPLPADVAAPAAATTPAAESQAPAARGQSAPASAPTPIAQPAAAPAATGGRAPAEGTADLANGYSPAGNGRTQPAAAPAAQSTG